MLTNLSMLSREQIPIYFEVSLSVKMFARFTFVLIIVLAQSLSMRQWRHWAKNENTFRSTGRRLVKFSFTVSPGILMPRQITPSTRLHPIFSVVGFRFMRSQCSIVQLLRVTRWRSLHL